MAEHSTEPQPDTPVSEREALRTQVRRLILLRETGPQRANWHRARKQAIWWLHRKLNALEQADAPDYSDDTGKAV